MAKPILLIRGISDRENAEQFSKAISNQFNGEYHILFVFDVDYKKHYISVIGDNNPILPKETKALLRKICALAIERDCGRVEWWCLDWNKPSIDFYLSLGAEAMSDWTVYRLDRTKIEQIADAL